MIFDRNKAMYLTADSSAIRYNHLNLPVNINVSGSQASRNITYVCDARGVKLCKVVVGSANGTTEYTGNYIYENGNLKQISQPEGYIEPDGNGWQYVYRYSDIWGNTRITYADDNNNGTIETGSQYSEIRREQNYYPFGLEHKGYNGVSYGVKNNLKTYQGQEFTEDLGLNTHEWKYRISDPAIGRFWQIDPLAESYTYNSTYAFQENKLGMGIELEGAELLGQEFAQDLIIRASEFFDGANKMAKGSSNMLNEAMSGKTAERMAKQDTQGPQLNPSYDMLLEGAAKVDRSLPNKEDARNIGNGLETTGAAITTVGLVTFQPEIVLVGEGISKVGAGINISVDLVEQKSLDDIAKERLPGFVFGKLGGAAIKANKKHISNASERLIPEIIIKANTKAFEGITTELIIPAVEERNEQE